MNATMRTLPLLALIVLLSLPGCEAGQSQASSPMVVLHLIPGNGNGPCEPDDDSDRLTLQEALDQAPVHIILAPGRYCLNGPLTVLSHSRIEGAGDGRHGGLFSELVQSRSATSLFHLAAVENVVIEKIRLTLPTQSLSQAPQESDCRRNPIDDALCMWQRPSAIAAHDTRHIRIEHTTLIGGRAGIALLDHPQLTSPSGGPESKLDPLEDGWEIIDDSCSGGDTPRNRHWVIGHNHIRAAQDGLLILNLSDSLIRANTISDSRRFNGIKIGCGPVRDNHIIANYLHGNGLEGLGDGIDIAWGWTEEEKTLTADDILIRQREDRPDGTFRGNLIEGNLAWNNLGNGIAIKVKQNDQGCGDYRTNPLYQLGSNSLRRNALWGNGRGGSLRDDPPLATTSQLELRCIQPQGAARLEVSGHLLAALLPPLAGLGAGGEPPFPITTFWPRHGAFLDRIHQSDYHHNWHHGLYDVRAPQPQAWDLFIGPDALSAAADNHFHSVHARAEAVSTPGLDLEPADSLSLEALLAGVAQTHGYHCRDEDGDYCPNICEALGGRNHLFDEGEGDCDCQLCTAKPLGSTWR